MREPIQPPTTLLRVFRWFCHPEYREDIEGDLRERFEKDADEKGAKKAKWLFVWDVVKLFRPVIIRPLDRNHTLNQSAMLSNYLKVGIRNIIKHKGFSFINVSGLAVGMACFTMIILYIQDELSFDRFHNDSDQIYRVVKERPDTEVTHSRVPGALMQVIKDEIPEVDHAVRLLQWNKGQLIHSDKVVHNTNHLYVENSFFDVFHFPFVSGNAKEALVDPSSIVLTERMAKKYFNAEQALGKTLTFRNQNVTKEYQVSGVLKDIPAQSHFRFDFLLSTNGFEHIERANKSWDDGELNAHTYIKLRAGTEIEDIDSKIQKLVETHKSPNVFAYSTQPLSGLNGIHLSSHRSRELDTNSSILYIKVLLIVALFVVLIAGINFVNLYTMRAIYRAKEVGVRKVIGATKRTLIWQFLIESLLISFLAGFMAVALAELSMPFLNSVLSKDLTLFKLESVPTLIYLTGVTFVLGILAGIYPAIHLSTSKPILMLKKLNLSSNSGLGIRRILVVTQFCLASILIVSIMVIQNQLDYMHTTSLGMDKEEVIIIENGWQLPKRDQGFAFRNELKGLSAVIHVGAGEAMGTVEEDGAFHQFRSSGSDKIIEIKNIEGDENLIDAFGIELVEGTHLSPVYSMNDWKIILNETAVKQLGLKEPVSGQTIDFIRGEQIHQVPISGVVKDFHLSSLHTEIQPIYMSWNSEALTIAVKLADGNIRKSLEEIESIWDKHSSFAPMAFYFLDKAIDHQYRSDRNFRTIFSAMTGMSLIIACLGLFGLAAFTVEQRTKEISIRKVLGASVKNIVSLLSREFIQLVLIANIIAWPIAWFAMNSWLENFAYRIDIRVYTFLVTGALALAIAVFAVGGKIIRVAIANPVDSLKDE